MRDDGTDRLSQWIGREHSATDSVTRHLQSRFEATLGPWLAPYGPEHAAAGLLWCLDGPLTPTAGLTADGHPPRGDFLPPVALPRRMWAGGRLDIFGPLPLEAPIMRNSRITGIEEKPGKSGNLCFVTVAHEYRSAGELLVRERQDIVYRAGFSGAPPPPRPPAAGPPPECTVTVDATNTLLFRYSALTFNSHRIHYDLAYARDVEGYPGLVVHGPLQATLLLNHALRHFGTNMLTFEFRSLAPLFAGEPFGIRSEAIDDTLRCSTVGADGGIAMQANARPLEH